METAGPSTLSNPSGAGRETPTVSLWKLVGMALLLQVVLLWDVGALLLTDVLVDGNLAISDYPFADVGVMALNRLLVVAVWALAVGGVYYWCKARGILSRLFDWRYERAVLVGSVAAVGLHVAETVAVGLLTEASLAPQALGEYNVFVSTYGSLDGSLVFLLQGLYYLFEALVILLMIALFQDAGERQFGQQSIPWGGIGLTLTWGAFHVLMSPSLVMLVLPMAMGVIYLVGEKHPVPVFLATFLVFFI